MQSQGAIALLMVVVALLNTAAQSLFKAGAGRGLVNSALMGGLFAYALSTVLYILVLRRVNLSVAYPLVIGSTMVATCLSGRQMFGEGISTAHWAGIALIILGILCIAVTPRVGV